jgi:hypothetical protein
MVKWVDLERPVICVAREGGMSLVNPKAANRTQLTKTLAKGGMVAGILAPLASHDLRYGAAHDTVNIPIPATINGLPTATVAMTLGHSISAYQAGVTAKYVGAQSVDTWTLQVEA